MFFVGVSVCCVRVRFCRFGGRCVCSLWGSLLWVCASECVCCVWDYLVWVYVSKFVFFGTVCCGFVRVSVYCVWVSLLWVFGS